MNAIDKKKRLFFCWAHAFPQAQAHSIEIVRAQWFPLPLAHTHTHTFTFCFIYILTSNRSMVHKACETQTHISSNVYPYCHSLAHYSLRTYSYSYKMYYIDVRCSCDSKQNLIVYYMFGKIDIIPCLCSFACVCELCTCK